MKSPFNIIYPLWYIFKPFNYKVKVELKFKNSPLEKMFNPDNAVEIDI